MLMSMMGSSSTRSLPARKRAFALASFCFRQKAEPLRRLVNQLGLILQTSRNGFAILTGMGWKEYPPRNEDHRAVQDRSLLHLRSKKCFGWLVRNQLKWVTSSRNGLPKNWLRQRW